MTLIFLRLNLKVSFSEFQRIKKRGELVGKPISNEIGITSRNRNILTTGYKRKKETQ